MQAQALRAGESSLARFLNQALLGRPHVPYFLDLGAAVTEGNGTSMGVTVTTEPP